MQHINACGFEMRCSAITYVHHVCVCTYFWLYCVLTIRCFVTFFCHAQFASNSDFLHLPEFLVWVWTCNSWFKESNSDNSKGGRVKLYLCTPKKSDNCLKKTKQIQYIPSYSRLHSLLSHPQLSLVCFEHMTHKRLGCEVNAAQPSTVTNPKMTVMCQVCQNYCGTETESWW